MRRLLNGQWLHIPDPRAEFLPPDRVRISGHKGAVEMTCKDFDLLIVTYGDSMESLAASYVSQYESWALEQPEATGGE